MKRKLVKILALGGIVFALTACPGPEPEPTPVPPDPPEPPVEEVLEVSLAELFEMDGTEWALDGKLVKVQELALQGKYGNTLIGGGSLGTTINTLIGLEVNVNELPTFEKGSGWGCNFTATGRVTDVNGRLVLNDADVEVVSEREYNAAGTSYTGGLPIHYCPEEYLDRSLWNNDMLKQMSGAYFPGYFQVASLPEEAAVDSATSFEVVFPGEDLDVEDLENESLITVQVPAGLSATAVERFNNWFFAEGNEIEVGDFVHVDTVLQYDAQENAGMGYVYTSFGELSDMENPPVIKDNWSDVADYFQDEFKNAFVDLDSDLPFSYVLSDEYISKDFKTYWKEEYRDQLVRVQVDYVTATITANFKPSKIQDYFEELCLKLEGTEENPGEYEFIGDYVETSGIYLWTRTNAKGKIDAQVLMTPESESSFKLFYTAKAFSLDDEYDTLALAKAAYEERVGAILEDTSWTSGLPAVANSDVENVIFDYTYESYYVTKYNATVYEYKFTIEFGADVSAENKQSFAQGCLMLLAGSGFTRAYYAGFGAEGLFNATTNEFVLSAALNSSGEFVINVAVLAGAQINGVSYPFESDAELIAAISAEWAGWNQASASYFPTTASSFTSFTLGENAVVEWSFLDQEYNDWSASWTYTPSVIFTLTYGSDLSEQNIEALVSMLQGLGFVAATHATFGEGYFNQTTYEFVSFMYDGAELMILAGLVAVPAVSMAITIANAGE